MVWLPPEILLIIISHIHDPMTLVSLRFVNKDWSAAASWQMDRMFLLLNMNKCNQDVIEKRRKDPRARDLIRSMVVNHPDGDYWHVSGEVSYQPQSTIRRSAAKSLQDYLTGSGRMKIDGRVKFFKRLSFFLRAKVGQFPNLDCLTLHLHQPRDHKPIPQGLVPRDKILQGAVDALLKALKKLGKTKKGHGLDELSIQCLPTQVRFPGSPEWDMENQQRVITKLRLKTMKIGLVRPGFWNRALEWVSKTSPLLFTL
jgi:hypothetical protein